MSKDNGGPAFPSRLFGQSLTDGPKFDGMSLRDWFAGQVVANVKLHMARPEDHARLAYQIADAMLEARK